MCSWCFPERYPNSPNRGKGADIECRATGRARGRRPRMGKEPHRAQVSGRVQVRHEPLRDTTGPLAPYTPDHSPQLFARRGDHASAGNIPRGADPRCGQGAPGGCLASRCPVPMDTSDSGLGVVRRSENRGINGAGLRSASAGYGEPPSRPRFRGGTGVQAVQK